jgi:hypothetical protein
MKGVAVMWGNSGAPEDWVEIQADDASDKYPNDFAAAQAVRSKYRCRVIWHAPWISASLDIDGGYVEAAKQGLRDAIPSHRRTERWILCVPKKIGKRLSR